MSNQHIKYHHRHPLVSEGYGVALWMVKQRLVWLERPIQEWQPLPQRWQKWCVACLSQWLRVFHLCLLASVHWASDSWSILSMKHIITTEARYLNSNKYILLTKREVKMAGYWPCSLFAFLWTKTKSRSIKTQKKNKANIQPSWAN